MPREGQVNIQSPQPSPVELRKMLVAEAGRLSVRANEALTRLRAVSPREIAEPASVPLEGDLDAEIQKLVAQGDQRLGELQELDHRIESERDNLTNLGGRVAATRRVARTAIAVVLGVILGWLLALWMDFGTFMTWFCIIIFAGGLGYATATVHQRFKLGWPAEAR
jgi:hypothetical protein